MPGPWIKPNKNTAKTEFLNLALMLLDGDRDLWAIDPVGMSLCELRRRYGYSGVRTVGNGLTDVRCADCGRPDSSPLRLHLQGGWLCIVCHREIQVLLGYEDEHGKLLPAPVYFEDADRRRIERLMEERGRRIESKAQWM